MSSSLSFKNILSRKSTEMTNKILSYISYPGWLHVGLFLFKQPIKRHFFFHIPTQSLQ